MFRNDIDYLSNLYSKEPQEILNIRQSCPQHLQKMQLHYSECRILSVILKIAQVNKVLELGTLVGCSTAWIARSLSGDDPLVVSVEKSENNYSIAKKNIDNLEYSHRIQLLHANALNVLQEYSVSQNFLFDAIFIDAKKVEYVQYLELSKQCLKRGGIIISDNTLMIHESIPEISEAIKKFNAIVENDTDFTSAVIPTFSGMTIMMKNK